MNFLHGFTFIYTLIIHSPHLTARATLQPSLLLAAVPLSTPFTAMSHILPLQDAPNFEHCPHMLSLREQPPEGWRFPEAHLSGFAISLFLEASFICQTEMHGSPRHPGALPRVTSLTWTPSREPYGNWLSPHIHLRGWGLHLGTR